MALLPSTGGSLSNGMATVKENGAARSSNTGGYKYKTDGVGSGAEKGGVVQGRAGGDRAT